MNAYEQKKAARIDRLRDGAQRRDAEASAAIKKVDQMAGVMNGTPVLIGHHSEKRHRRDLARMDANMRTSIEATKEAAELRRRADGAEESQTVSSDDPDAVEKLRAKLAELERQQAALKTVNARLRAGESLEAVAPLLDWWEDPVRRLAIWQSMGHKTVPTGNGSAEIRRVKARLAELAAKATAPAKEPEDVNGVRIEEGDNRVRILFAGKPGEPVRARLKSRGFRWSPTSGAWQRMASNGAWHDARECARYATESEST